MTDLLNLVRGFLMGSADIVPGVSGGTVALVLGIYERLVHSIRDAAGALSALVRGRLPAARERARRVEWRFVLVLVAGILIALLSLAALIERLLEDHPQETAAVFFGLVAGSILIAWRLIGTRDPLRHTVTAAVATAAFFLLGLRSGEVSDPATWAFLLAGSVAIVAMILPGISGSFILLMIGMYEAVLGAVNDRDLALLAAFALGALLGLAAFSTLLDRLLRDHHDTVMAGLVGLMAGSLRVLWPWPDGTDTARLAAPPSGDWAVPLLLAIAGFAVVLVIGLAARRIGHHH
jgi:putative membrane protein